MAPSAAAGTTGLERVFLIFLMKNQQTKLQRTKPSPAKRLIQQSIGQKLVNSKELPKTQSQQQKPPQKLAIHRSETRTNGKVFDLPIETRTNSEKHQLIEQELKRIEKNFNLPIKTPNDSGKPQSTEQELKRTVKNVKLPIKTSNER